MTHISAAPAQLTNMRLAFATMLDCQDAEPGSPRLALLYGHSGYGKSVAAAHVAAHFRAAYVEAKSAWTPRWFAQVLAQELGVVRLGRTAPALVEQIIDALRNDPVPIIIDEMDHLVKKQAVEIIRDIHDAADVPILMIGEEALPHKLKEWERFDNRILVATAAEPATLGDALMLRDHYCQRVEVGNDLVEAIASACKGVTRRIVTNLQDAQKAAIAAGTDRIDLALWGKKAFRTGQVATRRAA